MPKQAKVIAAAALLGLTGASMVSAQVVPGHMQGESFSVSTDPSRTNNLVGGGHLRTTGGGDDMQIQYEKTFTGASSAGIPSWSGGQNGDVVYTPLTSIAVLHARTQR